MVETEHGQVMVTALLPLNCPLGSVDRTALHPFSFVYCSCARVLIVLKFCVRFLCIIA